MSPCRVAGVDWRGLHVALRQPGHRRARGFHSRWPGASRPSRGHHQPRLRHREGKEPFHIVLTLTANMNQSGPTYMLTLKTGVSHIPYFAFVSII